ncbi:MAG: hypothetical protein JNM10_02950 [Planctomycetia bacterium]|nr:hypothetical protein [Planctomycetia bacterium]
MRRLVLGSLLLLGSALGAPNVRADVVPDPAPQRDAADDDVIAAGRRSLGIVIVLVGATVLAGILLALRFRRHDARAAVQP